MAWPVFKPPSGIPASGIPAGGNGYGPAWGGSAKGAHPPIMGVRELRDAGIKLKRRTVEERKRLAADKDARNEQLMNVWGDVALNSDNDMARIAAAEKAWDRINGRPAQRNENVNKNVEMTFEQMVEEALKRGKPPDDAV